MKAKEIAERNQERANKKEMEIEKIAERKLQRANKKKMEAKEIAEKIAMKLVLDSPENFMTDAV